MITHKRTLSYTAALAITVSALALTLRLRAEQTSDDGTPVIRSQSRLVLVDVVARDASGRPISGLSANDFVVLEDGKPQQIRAFDPHQTNVFTPRAAEAAAPGAASPITPKLPPGQYNNVPVADPNDAVNIILIDLLNTPTPDQIYARQQMVEMLKRTPNTANISIYVLGTTLRVVKGFNERPQDLIKSAEAISAQASTLLTTEEDRQDLEDTLQRIEDASAMSGGSPPTAAAMGGNATRPGTGIGGSTLGLTDRIREFNEEVEAEQADRRVRITLDAFNAISHAVSAYPGRKNLIWLSGGFPFSLGPQSEGVPDKFRSIRNYTSLVRETALQLSATRVAVYPVDVMGLQVGGASISSTGESSTGNIATSRPRISKVFDRQQTAAFEQHTAMDDLAAQTGGRAFYNTNGISLALSQVVESGARYYTLAYVPSNSRWNGKFRKIQVKLKRGGAHLEYRNGYYANLDQKLTDRDPKEVLLRAIQPGTPPSTMLLFLAQVLPPKAPGQPVMVDYVVDPHELSLTQVPAGKHALLHFLSVAWDAKNAVKATAVNKMDATFTPAQLKAAAKTGLRLHQELKLAPGSYHIRLAVMDVTTLNVGTIDVPITIQ